MTLRDRFAELRDEERRAIPPFTVGAPARHRMAWRPAAAFALVLLVAVALILRPHHPTFTPTDRAAAHAIAAWRPPTDVLLRMPSTGVSR
jgi:hypothetical protein